MRDLICLLLLVLTPALLRAADKPETVWERLSLLRDGQEMRAVDPIPPGYPIVYRTATRKPD